MQLARPQGPLSDSPWFWLYLFATAGLIALWLAGGKYGPRQAQLERQFQAREEARLAARGETPPLQRSSPERLSIPLWPLYYFLAALVAVGWGQLWWRRFRGATPPPQPGGEGSTP